MVSLEKSFGHCNPELTDEWSSKNEVSKSSGKKYLFECKKCKSIYECSLDKKTNYKSGCPYCRGLKVNNTNSLESNNPELLKYWDFSKNTNIKPSEVTRNSHKMAHWKCNVCEDETYCKIISKNSCSVCSSQKLKVGYNDIATTSPEIIKFMKNKDDAKKYMKYSNKKIVFKCEKCHIERNILISDVTSRGFKCLVCDSSSSLGERIINNLLVNVNFKKKVIFEWANNKRYDFFLPESNTIIEVHGEQHYEEGHFTNRTLIEEKNNDVLKKKLALDNGITNYVELKYNSNELNDFRIEILQSKLKDILHLDNDLKLEINSLDSDNKKVKVWEEYLKCSSPSKVSKSLDMSLSTVKKYLKQGNSLGKCQYPKVK